MLILKADTSVKVVIGPVVAVGDGFTPVTTLALSTADEAEIMKHDAAAVTDISGNTFAAITGMDGYYNLTITAAQLDTEGMLTVGINDDSLCLPVRHDFMVVNANVYDSLYAAATTDYLQVDTIQVSSDATAADNLELDYDGTGYAKANSTIGTCTTNTDMRGTDSAALASVCTEARLSELDAATGGKAANQIDVIETATTALNGTKIPDTISLANINAEVDTALNTALPGSPTADSINDVLNKQRLSIVSSTCSTGSTTTSIVTNLTEATDDHFNGRVIVFTSGALLGQATDITDYNGTTKTLTVTALTEAPANTDSFLIV